MTPKRSREGVVRGNGRLKGCFWRVRFFSAPGRFALKTPENLKWEEKKRTPQNTLLDDRFPARRLLRSFGAPPTWWPFRMLLFLISSSGGSDPKACMSFNSLNKNPFFDGAGTTPIPTTQTKNSDHGEFEPPEFKSTGNL